MIIRSNAIMVIPCELIKNINGKSKKMHKKIPFCLLSVGLFDGIFGCFLSGGGGALGLRLARRLKMFGNEDCKLMASRLNLLFASWRPFPPRKGKTLIMILSTNLKKHHMMYLPEKWRNLELMSFGAGNPYLGRFIKTTSLEEVLSADFWAFKGTRFL